MLADVRGGRLRQNVERVLFELSRVQVTGNPFFVMSVQYGEQLPMGGEMIVGRDGFPLVLDQEQMRVETLLSTDRYWLSIPPADAFGYPWLSP